MVAFSERRQDFRVRSRYHNEYSLRRAGDGLHGRRAAERACYREASASSAFSWSDTAWLERMPMCDSG